MITYGNNDVIVMQIVITMALMISLTVDVTRQRSSRRDAFYHADDDVSKSIVIVVSSNRSRRSRKEELVYPWTFLMFAKVYWILQRLLNKSPARCFQHSWAKSVGKFPLVCQRKYLTFYRSKLSKARGRNSSYIDRGVCNGTSVG